MKQKTFRSLFRRSSILWKMLLSIVCLICIPLISIQVFMFVQTSNEFEASNSKQQAAILQTLADSFQNELNSLARTAVRIGFTDAAAVPLDPNASSYDIYMAAQNLSEYNNTHPLVESVGIFYLTEDRILFNTFSKNLSYFCEQFFSGKSDGNQALHRFFSNIDTPQYFLTSAYEDCLDDVLFVAYPVSIASSFSKEAVVFFTIDTATLKNWCSVFIPASDSFAIIEADGRFLLQGSDFTPQIMGDSQFRDFLENPEQTRYSWANDESKLFYKYQDAAEGHTFVACIPRNSAEESLIHYADEVKWILILTVILMSSLLLITLYINYKPIFRLITQHIEPGLLDKGNSELDLIDSHFFAQDERITHQERLLASFVMGDLLSGNTITQEDADRYFPAHAFRSFAVATADISLSAVQSAAIATKFEALCGGRLIITTVPNQPETVFIQASGNEIDSHAFRNILQQTAGQIIDIPCGFSVGSVVTALYQVPLSYYDALFSTQHVDSMEVRTTSENLNHLIQNFEQQVASGDHKKALKTMDQLEAAVPELRPAVKRYFNFKIIHAYLTGMQRSSCKLSNGDIDQLISFKNGPHLFRILRSMIANAPAVINNMAELTQVDRQKKLLEYVDQNYLDNSLCLNSVADYMQTSIYTVSRLFKETTGIGFKEYIMAKRLQKACHLLETSHMTISEIAADCGFEDSNYFTIIFKRKYDMPPTKYREDILSRNPAQDEVPVN